MGACAPANPKKVIERLHDVMNRHDRETFLACLGPDYRSEQPAHPNRHSALRGTPGRRAESQLVTNRWSSSVVVGR